MASIWFFLITREKLNARHTIKNVHTEPITLEDTGEKSLPPAFVTAVPLV